MDIKYHTLINVMVTCIEGPYFLRNIVWLWHHKDMILYFHILKDALEKFGPHNVLQVDEGR